MHPGTIHLNIALLAQIDSFFAHIVFAEIITPKTPNRFYSFVLFEACEDTEISGQILQNLVKEPNCKELDIRMTVNNCICKKICVCHTFYRPHINKNTISLTISYDKHGSDPFIDVKYLKPAFFLLNIILLL